jgi:hypothetical protein
MPEALIQVRLPADLAEAWVEVAKRLTAEDWAAISAAAGVPFDILLPAICPTTAYVGSASPWMMKSSIFAFDSATLARPALG